MSGDVLIDQSSKPNQFKLLLTQIICIRLSSGRGIVRLRVGSPYDRLRFFPRSFDLLFILSHQLLLGFNYTLIYILIFYLFFYFYSLYIPKVLYLFILKTPNLPHTHNYNYLYFFILFSHFFFKLSIGSKEYLNFNQ